MFGLKKSSIVYSSLYEFFRVFSPFLLFKRDLLELSLI